MSGTVLITGANSGLGFETARQLAGGSRWDRIVLSARSQTKAEDARSRLLAATQTSPERLSTVVFDNTLPETIRVAVRQLNNEYGRLEALVLNAGGIAQTDPTGAPQRTESGQSTMYAMNVGGHALLVHELLGSGAIGEWTSVVFAGSEISRGIPVLAMPRVMLPTDHGPIETCLRAVARGQHGGKRYDPILSKLAVGLADLQQDSSGFADLRKKFSLRAKVPRCVNKHG